MSQEPASDQLWQIPARELGVQSLFRLHYQGPEGEGGFRLTLRLAAADRYRVTTVDAVGRAVWSLAVDGGVGLWVDHRQQRYCRFEGPLGLSAIPLSPFALPALPALLLGRLPEPPVSSPYSRDDYLEFTDKTNRRWTARHRGSEPTQWTLWEGSEPAVWWGVQGEEAILSERAHGIQLRWRRVLSEPLAELPPPPTVGEGYVLGCEQSSNPADLH